METEVLPIEVQRKGLDAFTRVGQEVREVLERRPASMVAVRIVRPTPDPESLASPVSRAPVSSPASACL